MELNDYKYEEINVGDIFEFKRNITADNLNEYAKLTGDFNPLHCDEEYAKKTIFKGRIIHGMLAGSLFSTLVGMMCPGKRNLYLSQSLNFKRHIYPNSELTVKGVIKNKIDSMKIIVLGTEILVDGKIVINGEAKVKVLGD
ncbi:MaoC like domain protein [uncultured archaeon]|nr:MaoC like domain protein [uncultured archaeon]